MATSSSSSSAVDLCEAADLDDATSRLFFSDISAAGPGLSWPAASEIHSTLTSQDSLVALCSKHGVPSELTPVCAQHLGWRACTPPTVGSNKMCVYAAALDAGLRFPLHGFYARVLRHYRLAPSQLTPNTWSYLAAFVLLCQDACVEPLVSAFRYFFTICAHSHKGKPTGCHHFQPNHDVRRRLFTGTLPSWSGWKSRFFFLDCPSGWKCQVKWGKPRKQDARRVQLTDTVIEKLKQKGCIDIKVFLAKREMPVGDPAALAPLQSAVKAEAGAGAAAENASTRKRSRLSPAAVLSQRQPLPTSPPAGLAPIRASSTGGRSGHIPPAGFAPIGASSTGGRSGHIPPPGLAPIRASSTGGHNGHIPPPGLPPIRASSTGDHSGHIPPSQQRSFGESTSTPWQLRAMRARAQDVSIGGSSEITPPAPHTMCASDVLQLWEARANADEQAAMIAKLNQELHLVKTWNTQWQKELRAAGAKHAAEIAELIAHLRAANDRNNHLNEELVRLDKEYVAERDQLIGHLRTASIEVARLQAASVEVAQLKEEHAAESAQLKEELAAEVKQLKEELADDAEQLKHEGYTMGASDMRDLALAMCKGVISPDELKVELLLDHSHQIQGASPVVVEDQ
jgi:hypothetical protein